MVPHVYGRVLVKSAVLFWLRRRMAEALAEEELPVMILVLVLSFRAHCRWLEPVVAHEVHVGPTGKRSAGPF